MVAETNNEKVLTRVNEIERFITHVPSKGERETAQDILLQVILMTQLRWIKGRNEERLKMV